MVTTNHAASKESSPPLLSQAARFWSHLGWISFGGTAAHLGIMHEALVQRKGWIKADVFFHALGLCMLLPGPEAQQLAIYLGWKLNGTSGGILAGLLFILPSVFVLLVLSLIVARFGNLPWISAIFTSLRPAVLALVLLAWARLVRRSLLHGRQWAVASAAFIAIYCVHAPVPLVMGAAIILGLALALPHTRSKQSQRTGPHVPAHRHDPLQWNRILRHLAVVVLTGSAAGLAPLLALYLFAPDFPFWAQLSLFFIRTACITVGGSYTVIPYVAHAAIYNFHWLTQQQMVDGFALAETTPGPLIIVVAFVGFMAGFHHFHGSLLMGSLALFVTTLYTFLPGFLFIFSLIPFEERTRNNQIAKSILDLVVAVVCAAMADLALFLAKGVLFRAESAASRSFDWVAALIALLSLYLLGTRKVQAGAVIASSLALGIARGICGA